MIYLENDQVRINEFIMRKSKPLTDINKMAVNGKRVKLCVIEMVSSLAGLVVAEMALLLGMNLVT